MKRVLFGPGIGSVILVLLASWLLAQRAIIMPLPEAGQLAEPLALKSCRVEIENQIAEVRADITFHNQYGRSIEGTFLFPLPSSTAIHDFVMYVDGKRLEGELLTKEQAREIYDRIVRRLRDPALLEYVGRDLFQASLFPIPAYADARIELRYEQLLEREAGLTEVVYPLHTVRSDAIPLGELVFDIRLRSQIPLKSIYSPTHDVDVAHLSDNEARIGFEGKQVPADRDFVLYYTTSEQDLGANLIAHRQGREDGFFLILVAPKISFHDEEISAKDIVFVFDTSGSMAGDKIEQARRALLFCLHNLNTPDRFGVITFATTTRSLKETLVPAEDHYIEEVGDFVKRMKAAGGTNIEEAILEALRMLKGSDRPSMVLFLTDGFPTVGEIDTDRLVENLGKATETKEEAAPRLFTFGVGDEINTPLLDRLTRDHRGAAEYVRPQEDIELKVSNFYAQISHPALTDLELRLEGVKTYDVYPPKLGDLFYGTELRVLGRYEGEGDAKLSLTGKSARGREEFSYAVYLPQREDRYAFLPRLWAIRKVGYLLDEIRLRGENKELKDEIVELALTYGIVTPYTSFLVNENDVVIARRARETQRAFLEAQVRHDRFGEYAEGEFGGLSSQAYFALEARGLGMRCILLPDVPAVSPEAPAPGFDLGGDWVHAKSGAEAIVGAQGIRGMQVNDAELRLDQRHVRNIGRATFYYDPETNTWVDSRYDQKFQPSIFNATVKQYGS
ncbi:MAG: VIT domain-containing protein [Candidatus Zipacnadales bacterium]